MIVDSSALVAILLDEPEAPRFAAYLATEEVSLSAASLTETLLVLRGRAEERIVHELDEMLRVTEVSIVPLDERQARLAGDAYARYGRGSGSRARLNYGDCFSYALAITRDEPLLFKGDDFVHTDVRLVE
ncbi:type II toxin-antitoxin system VapC family toxin [Microbacterium sp. AGC62]